MNTVAIQGQPASFHDIVAHEYFGNEIKILHLDTFSDVFSALSKGDAAYAIVAIENSLYGMINEVYDLLLNTGHKISGEHYLKISQCLIGIPGSKINDITEVHSHPVALAQCEKFLTTRLPNVIKYEAHDTASSVMEVKKSNNKTRAAIASAQAAKTFNMKIIAEGIESNKENFTRFVILQSKNAAQTISNANKTSIVLQTPRDTKAGSLYNSLGVFAKRGINLTTLHSRPIIGKAWHYMFYIDIIEDVNSSVYKEAFRELESMGCSVTILGKYKSSFVK